VSYLTVEQLTTPIERRFVDVEIPELGGKVRIQSATAREKTEFENSFRRNGKPINERQREIRERYVVRACVEPKLTLDHVRALGDQDAAVVDRIVNEVFALWGVTDSDVEALAKNSEQTESSD
jgi:hypothetical protein